MSTIDQSPRPPDEVATLLAKNSELLAKNEELFSDNAALVLEVATLRAASTAATEQIAKLKADSKTADAKAVEMLAKVGQTPVVPAVERRGASAAATEPKGIARVAAFFRNGGSR